MNGLNRLRILQEQRYHGGGSQFPSVSDVVWFPVGSLNVTGSGTDAPPVPLAIYYHRQRSQSVIPFTSGVDPGGW